MLHQANEKAHEATPALQRWSLMGPGFRNFSCGQHKKCFEACIFLSPAVQLEVPGKKCAWHDWPGIVLDTDLKVCCQMTSSILKVVHYLLGVMASLLIPAYRGTVVSPLHIITCPACTMLQQEGYLVQEEARLLCHFSGCLATESAGLSC